MKICELFEAKTEKKESLLPVDVISMMLFKKKSGIITDPKRDKNKKYVGVSNERSVIKDVNGKSIRLTFDNSTDSGEFEIDSLTPLKIEKGGAIDKSIKKLFTKHELDTKKTVGYLVKGDTSYIREIHLGEKLGRSAEKLVTDLLKILRGSSNDSDDSDDTSNVKEDPKTKKDKKVK